MTRAAGGIGAAVAERLSARGWAVAGLDLTSPPTRLALQADVSDPEVVEDAASRGTDELGLVRLLVTAAGRAHSRRCFGAGSPPSAGPPPSRSSPPDTRWRYTVTKRLPRMPSDQQRADFERGVAALRRLGANPVGYRAPSWQQTEVTLWLVAEADFLNDSSLMDDDRPYLLSGSGHRLAELPVHWSVDD